MASVHEEKHKRSLLIGAIGIVYGDIGTSPLYALKSCFIISGLPVAELHVLGLISLFLWSLFIVVTLKYVTLVMPVDHANEGGILALSARCSSLKIKHLNKVVLLLGLVGMSLFFGDCIITPAISVLSAIEGIKFISPTFAPYILPISVFTIALLFMIQKNGSGHIGRYFGVMMIMWFIVIGLMGMMSIIHNIVILKALNPYYALHFLVTNGHIGFLAIGGVILAVTGAEALYADMGHFGRHSIQLCWTYFIFPALILNYLGQGALLLSQPEAISNPFYLMVPGIMLYPLVVLSTLATIIASQSVISGVFSLGWQAIMLNYLPRMKVIHTSDKQIGQVYVPVINYMLCILTIAIVLIFKTSDDLASAYGLSVSGIMLITTFLIAVHALYELKWSRLKLCVVFIPLCFLDLTFFVCSLAKLFDGAWCTVLVTALVFFIIYTWMNGNKGLISQRNNTKIDVNTYLKKHVDHNNVRIPGVAIFLSRMPGTIPKSLSVHLQHNKMLHEKVFLVSILTKPVPRVSVTKRFVSEELFENVFQITAHFGFKEVPDIHKIMRWAHEQGLVSHDAEVCYLMSRSILVLGKQSPLRALQARLFRFLCNSSQNATEFYRIPHGKVIEFGLHYKI
ncbi:MAG: KUP/HAK/KT family potassium transporter [Pseudomonadota bacterium]